MRTPSKISLVVVLGLVVVISLVLICNRSERPQYVFLICLDSVRPDHLRSYGYSTDTSPRIDELASRGALFEDAIAQAPWTIPSIATILSSRFPSQHGARRTEGTRVTYTGISENFIKTLSAQGFKTSLFTGGLTIRGKIPASELTYAALEWLRENIEQRCFTVIHHYDTHGPYIADRECIDRLDPGYKGPYRVRFGDFELLKQARVGRLSEAISLTQADIKHIKALYDCQIIRADRSIGMLVDSLSAWNCLEKSMIIIFADHGEEFLEHGSIDHGQTVYEESIKVPLIIFCPSLVKEAIRIKDQVGLIDIAPTIFDALDIAKPSYFEGLSLMPLMSSRFRGSVRQERPCGLPATCLISESIARRSEKKALRCPPWKLIFDPFFGASELYDISRDPGETENLIEVYPQIASSLADTLLIMERYYPGGWCIAWRGGDRGGSVRGTIRISSDLIEAVGHNIFPEIDSRTDSLVVSEDWTRVFFTSAVGRDWEGVEARMATAVDAVFEISIDGVSELDVIVGNRQTHLSFPAVLSPSAARVERKDLHKIFRNPDADCVIFWIEPGSEPTARERRQEELKRQLKAIGYID